MFLIVSVLSLVASTAPGETANKPGKAVFESAAAADCKTFSTPRGRPNPGEPGFEHREPYRGEDMLKPIGPLDAMGRPPMPSFRLMKLPEELGRTGKATGFVTINSLGQVVRVEATSPTDARLAAFFAANVSLWQYPARADDPGCVRFEISVEMSETPPQPSSPPPAK